MKKSLIVWGLLLTLVLSPMNSLAEKSYLDNEESIQSGVDKVVVVGYYREEKEDIFGDICDEDIRKDLHDKINDLMLRMESEEIDDYIFNQLDDKLIVSITDKDKGINLSNSDKFDKVREIEPFGYDESPVSAYIDYSVGFQVADMGIAYGDYVTIIEGIVNYGKYAVIENLTTINIGRTKFPVKDFLTETEDAYNVFYLIDSGNFRAGRGDFTINRTSGKVIFYGVR